MDLSFYRLNHKGISTVIGVILIVGVTVAIVALVSFIGFNIVEGPSSSADIAVELKQYDGEVRTQILRNENVKEIKLVYEDGTSKTLTADPGSSVSLTSGNGQYSVIAVLPDGSEQVIRQKMFSGIETNGESFTGTVSYNPPAQGLQVTLQDGDGNVLDTDVTDKYGSYELTGSASKYQINVSELKAVQSSENVTQNTDINLIDDNVVSSPEKVIDVLMNGTGSSTSPYEVQYASDLQAIDYSTSSETFKLTRNISASHTSNWNNDKGFNPISPSGSFVPPSSPKYYQGKSSEKSILSNTIQDRSIQTGGFDGTFDGNNKQIKNITIDRPNEDIVGLFGQVESGGIIFDVGVKNANVTGNDQVGIIAGSYSRGSFKIPISKSVTSGISGSYVTGNLTGNKTVGGIIGSNSGGTVQNTFSKATVNGVSEVGVIAGRNGNSAEIIDSYSRGTVNGSINVGGVVGVTEGDISGTYSVSNVTGTSNVGGIAGSVPVQTENIRLRAIWNSGESQVSQSGTDVSSPLGDRPARSALNTTGSNPMDTRSDLNDGGSEWKLSQNNQLILRSIDESVQKDG